MPANLPPQYHEAEKVFREVKTIPEKIEALENMLAIMPHHKGTDHLRAELRTRLAKLAEEAEKRPSIAKKGQQFKIIKEGAGQVAMVGLANSGKSELFASLTGAPTKVAPYPYTTQKPIPGMMKFENVRFQLVDLPAIDYRDAHSWLYSNIRYADLLLIVIDLSQEAIPQMENIKEQMARLRIRLLVRGAELSGEEFVAWKKAVIVGNKNDMPGAAASFQALQAGYGSDFPVLSVSAFDEESLRPLGKVIFDSLDIMRIYCKEPGQPPDMGQPSIVKKNSTVEDFAESIHKDLRKQLKYALVWGSTRFGGQQVNRRYIPQDGDIIELKT